MAKQCTICNKKGMLARKRKKLRTRYNPTPKYRQKPNLQIILVPENITRKEYQPFSGKRILVCTKCRKTMLKPPTRKEVKRGIRVRGVV